MVIVDTSVWISFFNRKFSQEKEEVERLIDAEEVVMVGVILTELVQGTRYSREKNIIKDGVSALPYLEVTKSTWLLAGEVSAGLLRRGITLAVPDLVIAALAAEHSCTIFSLDTDFQRIPGLSLYTPT